MSRACYAVGMEDMRFRDMAAAGAGTVLGVVGVIAGFLGMVVVGGAIIYGTTVLLSAVWAVLTGQTN